MRYFFGLAILFCTQLSFAQKKDKVQRIKFCGAAYKSRSAMMELLKEEFAFLKLNDRDTVVDIGAGSGWFNGAVAAGTNIQDVHFILVDIDTSCLNQAKVNNMVDHYSNLKGAPLDHSFQLHVNTVDSLWLPLNRYKKAWILNVLHEIPDKEKMISDAFDILETGGELVLLELKPRKPGEKHGGCNEPLLTSAEWNLLFEKNGFRVEEQVEIIKHKKRHSVQMVRYVKKSK